jgi:mannose-6-phosphate isomerase-like protein (cupin superfamily)
MAAAQTRPASHARHYDSPPQLEEGPGARTWLTRGANFVIAVSRVNAGATLRRADNPDESAVLLPEIAATIEAGGERIEAAAESLTIVPPGSSTVTARGDGLVVRVFSTRAADLAARAANGSAYAQGAPDVTPLVPWPDPPGGFRLRHYRLADHAKADSNMRIFRCTNLMINVLAKRATARDVTKLSPHSHADFEQASLAVEGDYVHHLRYPWTPDMTAWREDEHLEIGSPSVTVIPPNVVHTSRNVGGPGWLIDVFAPPRVDFSTKPGLVCNADEYPMPR